MRYYIFINEKKKNNNGMFPIIIVFRLGNNMFNVSTGLTTTEKFEGFVFPKSQINSAAKTAVLAKIIGEVEEYILLHKQTPYDEQKAALREIVSGKVQAKPKVKTLAVYVAEYRDTLENDGTRTMYRITADKVREFDGNATFDTVNKEWLQKFETYFIKGKGMSVNGIAIHIRNIRTVFNWAIDNEWTTNYPFRKFKVRQEKTVIRNLLTSSLFCNQILILLNIRGL